MRIALFITCYNDVLYPDVGQAVVRLFDRLGMAMEFPREQACCGQLHFNTGYQEQSLPMARRFARTFAGFDAVVTPSPSCASMVRHHYTTLAQRDASGELSQQLGQLVPRVYAVAESGAIVVVESEGNARSG